MLNQRVVVIVAFLGNINLFPFISMQENPLYEGMSHFLDIFKFIFFYSSLRLLNGFENTERRLFDGSNICHLQIVFFSGSSSSSLFLN